MGHIRQSIHNLLGRVLPSGGTPRVPSGYTLANARGDAKTNLHETTVLDALKPTDRARALLAMAPLVADRGSVNAERFAWHQFAEQLPAKALATATARPATREAVDLPAPVSVRLPLDDVTPAPTAAPDESVEPFGSNDFHAEVAAAVPAEVPAEIPTGLPAGLPEVPAAILAEDILRQPSFDRPPPLPEPAPAAYGLVLVGANPAGTRYLPPPFVDLQVGTPVAASH